MLRCQVVDAGAGVKILFVHNHYQLRSGEEQVFEHDRLAAEGAGHIVVTYTRDNRELEQYGALQRITLGPRTSWAWDTQRELSRILERERPAIAHFVNTLPLISPAAFWTCKRYRARVVYNVQNYRLACPAATFVRAGAICTECPDHGLSRGVRYACYRGSRAATLAVAVATQLHAALGTYARAVDRFLVPSAFMRDTLIRYAQLDEQRLVVKPNCVWPDPASSERAGDSGYLAFVGRLTTEKGLLTLLAAYAALESAPPLRIVGDGPLREALHARVNSDPRLCQVELLGAVSHERAIEHIRGARALIVPSEWFEGVPLTLLEAFACSVPVIASRIGSLAETVRHRENGLLFEPGNADELGARVRELLADARLAQQLGARGREIFLQHHTLESNARALDAVYRELT